MQKQLEVLKPYAPSLYVRVYLWEVQGMNEYISSLIICEGVSFFSLC